MDRKIKDLSPKTLRQVEKIEWILRCKKKIQELQDHMEAVLSEEISALEEMYRQEGIDRIVLWYGG